MAISENWDSIYDVYQARIQPEISRVELFNVIADMGNELRDGHVILRSEFNISKYLNYYLDYPRNYNIQNLEKNYWGDYNITVPLIHQEIDSVGYIHYRSFVSMISESDLDFVFELYKDSKGLIIDIRENEGGNPANGFRILKRLVQERKLIYRHRWVDGPERDDFTDWEDVYLDPEPELLGFDGPVTVLTNRFCYSAANWFAAMTKAYPNIQLLGDYTGGGGGVPQGENSPMDFPSISLHHKPLCPMALV
jgi:hypothetical protein